ncbi:MAG: cysteine desulfurase [Armatimonadetes bacterium]|nr:cysteine desulfurase [Armatimonadota bacterium]
MVNKRIFLDHASTTPVRPEVIELISEAYQRFIGNPSSLHRFGQESRRALEEAREKIAGLLGCHPDELFFTSGGTEANNMAIKGVARALSEKGTHLVATAVEHHSVLDACRSLEREGFSISLVPVDSYGRIVIEAFREALTPQTILASVMHGQNEVGTLEPVSEIGEIARSFGVPLHSDAVQTVGRIPVLVDTLGVDLLSLSSHKFGGPKGVGALYVRRGTPCFPLIHGGNQEEGRRPGTENLAGILGMARALELSMLELEDGDRRLHMLRTRFIQLLRESVPRARVNGHPSLFLQGIISVTLPGVPAEEVLICLDQEGIAASAGAACVSGALEPSHVLLSMGLTRKEAEATIRISPGKENDVEDVEVVIRKIRGIVLRTGPSFVPPP